MKDYTGKSIFLGIDVHYKTYSITAMCDGMIIKKDTIQAIPIELVKYCKKFKGACIRSAYEAGFCGFNLHRILIKHNIENIVVNPASIETEARVRTKTDKLDSTKICVQLAAGRLKGIYVPTEEREQYQSLTRLRAKLLKDRNRTGSQLKMLLHKFGLMTLDKRQKISKAWLNKQLNLNVSPPLKFSIKEHIDMWKYLTERIKATHLEMSKQAMIDCKIESVYRSVPCIGPISARILANELGDLLQFKNEDQLYSYIGFTPREHSSGEHIRKGHISRQGKPILRKILIQIAWKAIKKDPALLTVFERIAKGLDRNKAIVAVARRLIGKIRACFVKNELYKYEIKE